MMQAWCSNRSLARWLVALVLLTGCAKGSAGGSYAPAYDGYGSSGGDGYGYAAEESYAEAEVMAVSADAAPQRAAKKERRAFKSDEATMTMPAAPPAEPMPVDMTSESKPAPSEPDASEPSEQALDARQIIYTATLLLAVYELDAAIAFAEDVPRRHGGWIQARYDYSITLRVPAEQLEVVMVELATLGDVLGKTLQADDVTAQYTDLEARIEVLEQLVEQLELLLAQAKTVEESLKVRQELERVRIELETAKAQMRSLAESIAFSTLTVSFSQRGPTELPSSNDPFPWVDQLGVESTEFR
jgi:hypothetical protein